MMAADPMPIELLYRKAYNFTSAEENVSSPFVSQTRRQKIVTSKEQDNSLRFVTDSDDDCEQLAYHVGQSSKLWVQM